MLTTVYIIWVVVVFFCICKQLKCINFKCRTFLILKSYPSHFKSSPQIIFMYMRTSIKCAYNACFYVFVGMVGSNFRWNSEESQNPTVFLLFQTQGCGIRNASLDILVSFVLGMLLSCTAECVFRYDSIVYTKRYLICLDILLFRRTYFQVTASFYTVNIFNQSRLSIATKKKRKEKKRNVYI